MSTFNGLLVLQMIPVLLAVSVVVVTVLYFLLRRSTKESKKGPVTLQDPMAKYPLPLISKEVSCVQTQTLKEFQV